MSYLHEFQDVLPCSVYQINKTNKQTDFQMNYKNKSVV